MIRVAVLFLLAIQGLAALVSPGSRQQRTPITPAVLQRSDTAGTGVPLNGLKLPLKSGSVRFAVIGDNGTGERAQYEVADQMAKFHEAFPFEFVIMLGDNLYGGSSPKDFAQKFEIPYKALIDGGVKFYASLGNHDNPNERFYSPFNMGGQRYYSFKKGNVQFFALDSNYMDPQQLAWIEQQLHSANSTWRIPFFHHALYSDGTFHGPDVDLRTRIQPLFEKYGVDVVLSGHEHVYERFKPLNGIYYFIIGNSGELRFHNLKPSANMAKGFDSDRDFMLVEVAGDELYFQTISRTGQTVDYDMLVNQRSKSDHPVAAKPN